MSDGTRSRSARPPGYAGPRSNVERLAHLAYWLVYAVCLLWVVNGAVDVARRRYRGEDVTRSTGRGSLREVLVLVASLLRVPARLDLALKDSWIWHPNAVLPFESGHPAIRADPTVPRDPNHRVPDGVAAAVYRRDDHRCVVCGRGGDGTELHLDHVRPVSRGGEDAPSNLRVLCRRCHECRHRRLFD